MWIVIVLLVVVAFVAGCAAAYGLLKFFNVFERKNDTRSSTSFSEVVKANEMISLRSYFQDIIENSQTALLFSKSKILLICRGRIECRFDMSKARIDPREETKHVTIIMPPCDIQTIIETKEKDVRVYDATRGLYDFMADFFSDEPTYSFNKVVAIIEKEKPRIEQDALENLHIRERAKANARHVLENLAKTFGYTAEISFEDDDNTTSNSPKALNAGSSAAEVIDVESEAIQEGTPAS